MQSRIFCVTRDYIYIYIIKRYKLYEPYRNTIREQVWKNKYHRYNHNPKNKISVIEKRFKEKQNKTKQTFIPGRAVMWHRSNSNAC